MIAEDVTAIEMIHGDAEESLDLRRMQVHSKDAVRSRRFDHVRTDPSADGNARLVFFVPFGITEERDHGRDLLGTRAFNGIDPEQKLDQIIVDRTVNSLNQKHVAAPHILLDSNEYVPFAKHMGLARDEFGLQFSSDRLSQQRISRTGKNGQISLRRLKGMGSRPR